MYLVALCSVHGHSPFGINSRVVWFRNRETRTQQLLFLNVRPTFLKLSCIHFMRNGFSPIVIFQLNWISDVMLWDRNSSIQLLPSSPVPVTSSWYLCPQWSSRNSSLQGIQIRKEENCGQWLYNYRRSVRTWTSRNNFSSFESKFFGNILYFLWGSIIKRRRAWIREKELMEIVCSYYWSDGYDSWRW